MKTFEEKLSEIKNISDEEKNQAIEIRELMCILMASCIGYDSVVVLNALDLLKEFFLKERRAEVLNKKNSK